MTSSTHPRRGARASMHRHEPRCPVDHLAEGQPVRELGLIPRRERPQRLRAPPLLGLGAGRVQLVRVARVSLGSMSARWLTYEPGSCVAAGGPPFGEVEKVNPQTVCCLDDGG